MHINFNNIDLISSSPTLAYADALMNYSGAACVTSLDQCS